MSVIANVISTINDTISGNQFTDKRFQKGTFYGIGEEFERRNDDVIETFIGESDVNGNVTPYFIDDTKTFILYHVVNGVQPAFPVDSDDGFGDGRDVIEVYDMRLVFWGDRKRLQLTREDILTGIVSGFPQQMIRSELSGWGVSGVTLEMGNTNIDKNAVYRNEYSGTQLRIKPQHIMLSMEYTVEITYRQGCITLCQQ